MDDGERVPTLVCLFGAPATGKTTVGAALCRLTGYALFHGHVVADALTPFFPFGTPSLGRLSQSWRVAFFEEARRAGLSVVTTAAWRFDLAGDAAAIGEWLAPYQDGGRAICVELVAPLAVRLERNRGEDRRQKNAYWVTDDYLREMDAAHRYDSGGTFPFDLPHLWLETEHRSAEATAQVIAARFSLPRRATRDSDR